MRLLRGAQQYGDADIGSVMGDAVVAQAALREWKLETDDPAELPVLALPFPLAYLVSIRSWSHVVVLARWHRGAFGVDHRQVQNETKIICRKKFFSKENLLDKKSSRKKISLKENYSQKNFS